MFLYELKIFAKHIFYWLISFAAVSTFLFAFGLQKITFRGSEYILPLPSEHSFTVQVFNRMRSDLLPPGVQLVATNPMSAFVSQITLSLLLGFLLTMPFFVYRVIVYLRPALLARERRAVLWSLLPLAVLFFSGVLFSYFFLIPTTFAVLYPYAAVMGAVAFFSIDEFGYYAFGLMAAAGVMFLLPIFMTLLSFIGVIPAEVWKRNWRHACILFLIVSAVITPDGTGVTMLMLSFPLSALYWTGYLGAVKMEKRPLESA